MKPYYNHLCSNLLLLFLTLLSFSIHAQVDPTLAVGLEQLTMNKGTIDVKAVTEIIMEKQKELKKEALKRFMLKMFPNNNYTTKFYIQNALHILLNEKNPHVIEKEILEMTTNYALALGIAKIYASPSNQSPQLSDASTITLIDEIKAGYRSTIISKSTVDEQFANNKFYGLMVDIVSHSLSNAAKIKEKGFYKYPVDYKKEIDDHANLKKDKLLYAKVEQLEAIIQRQINDYIINFEIIKEFYMRYKGRKSVEIINTLVTEYYLDLNNLIEANSDSNQFDDLSGNFKTTLNKVQIAKDKITSNEKSLAKLKELQASYFAIQNEQKRQLTKINNTLKISVSDANAISELDKRMTDADADTDTTARIALNNFKNAYLVNQERLNLFNTALDNNKDVFNYIKLLQPSFAGKTSQEVLQQLVWSEFEGNAKKNIQLVLTMIEADTKELAKDKNLYKLVLKKITGSFLYLDLGLDKNNESHFETINKYALDMAEIYVQLDLLGKKEIISLKDIKYIEETVMPILIKYTMIAKGDKNEFKNALQNFKMLSGLLKVNAVSRVAGSIGEYSNTFDDILTFVSNLDKLDEAGTYQSIINLLQDNNEIICNALKDVDNEKFKKIYQLFINAVKKYTVINTGENYVNIDVVSFLSDLQQYYGRNETSWFSLYLTLGLSENFFSKPLAVTSNETITNIGFASEKIGLKFTMVRIGRFDDNSKLISNDIYLNRRNPFFNEIYGLAYASGLLYSLANLTTNENFDFPHVGVGIGLRFYNALDLNLSLGLPFIDGEKFGNNGFLSVGLDIPLAEYLEKIGKK